MSVILDNGTGVIDGLLADNKRYAEAFTGSLSKLPTARLAVVAYPWWPAWMRG